MNTETFEFGMALLPTLLAGGKKQRAKVHQVEAIGDHVRVVFALDDGKRFVVEVRAERDVSEAEPVRVPLDSYTPPPEAEVEELLDDSEQEIIKKTITHISERHLLPTSAQTLLNLIKSSPLRKGDRKRLDVALFHAQKGDIEGLKILAALRARPETDSC